MNFRPIEPWMQKGAQVQMPNNTGILKNFVTATLGESTGYSCTDPVMLTCNIQFTGVGKDYPCNPWDMSEVKPKEPIPFPEHLG